MKQESKHQGFVWETGQLAGCSILLPANRERGISIGTEEVDGPAIIIKSDSYVYFYVAGAGNGNPHDYHVVYDFDGPICSAHSGETFHFGKESVRLL